MLFDISPSAQKRFVRLTDYCVVEFIMEPLASSIFTTAQYKRLQNAFNLTNQVYNNDSAINITGNIKDLTLTSIVNSISAYLDSEKVPNYTAYDTNLTETTVPAHTVITDTVKFHFMAGFDFEDLAGVQLTIKAQQNDGNFLILANLLLSPLTFDSILRYDPKPLFLNGINYDRFVIVKIPSVKNINNDYANAGDKTTTFSYDATGGVALVPNLPITIGLGESTYHKTIYGTNSINYDGYEIDHYFEAKVAQTNELDDLGVVIQEASDGDYIEFYATWNGGFPDELIVLLDKKGSDQDWNIIHQLTVIEQVGAFFIQSPPMTFYQDTNYDAPLKFRPILDHANEAISASIDYIMRLYNKLTGDQEIREGSVTITNPNKYGKQLVKIQLNGDVQSHKIYNKIVQKSYDSTLLFIEPGQQDPTLQSPSTNVSLNGVTKVQYIPMFFTNSNVVVAEKSRLVTNVDNSQIVSFGQGKLPIIIQPFDNVFKFKVYTMNGTTLTPFSLNMNSEIKIVFNSTANPISFQNINDATKENLGEGEVVFKVARDNSVKILASTDRTFYITVKADDGTETPVYSGKWYTDDERDTVTDLYQAEFDKATASGETQSAIDSAESKNTDAAVSNSNQPAVTQVSIPGYIKPGATAASTSVIKKITPLSS